MAILGIISLFLAAIAALLAPVFMALVPFLFIAPLFGGFYVVGFSAVVVAAALSPFGFLIAFWWLRRFALSERRHINDVGREVALWSVSRHAGGRLLVDFVTMCRTSADSSLPVAFDEHVWTSMSIQYSGVVLAIADRLSPGESLIWAFLVSLVVWYSFVLKHQLRFVRHAAVTFVLLACVLLVSPAEFVYDVASVLLRMGFYLTPLGWSHLRVRLEWSRLWMLSLLLDMALFVTALNEDMAAHYSEKLAGRRRKVGAVMRQNVMKAVSFISNVRLPAFIRNRFQGPVTLGDLENGRQIMADLGWPVNVDVVPEPPKEVPKMAGRQWSAWKVADTSFATGIRQLKLDIAESLADLSTIAPAYYRTETYKDLENELQSTARYFQDKHVDFSFDVLDDVWHIVRPIFAGSRLTKFGDIIYLWEKKYALGFWMTDETGRRKLSRRSFIAKVGMPKFKELWARTFVRASEIMPVAHISVKDEALSPLKRARNVVRTILGSPISHYIGSTIFSHWPNHHFDFDGTPIKVGMPLNGYWMGKIFDRHARFNVHIEGDFTAFDSTIEGPIKQVIRQIRKRGFSSHKDHIAICDLIDVMYDQIDHQFLGHTSTGEVYRKGGGLTTGHSSTSMDNSVALVTFYVSAWKSLTGLSAREFLHFNELSCYGDDHMLSVSATAPRSWTAHNIQRTMAKWGVTNNLETKKLAAMTFLSKHNSAVTPAIARELNINGVTGVNRAVWHDKAKLVGKLTAKLKNTEPTYRATRLFSYLQLTAHHPEVYAAIVRELRKPPLDKIIANNFKVVPTYTQVLQNWYKPSHEHKARDLVDPEECWSNDGRLVVVGAPSLVDHMLQAISFVPDLLNPTLFNHGPSRALVSTVAPHLSWIPTLLQTANGIAAYSNTEYHLKRTPYAFVDVDIVQAQRFSDPFTDLLLRHWLLMFYISLRPDPKIGHVASWLLRKSADLAFLAKGQVITDLPRSFFPFDTILVAALLSKVRAPFDPLAFMKSVDVPDLASWFDTVYNRVLSFVWTSVPANFGEVDALVSQLGSNVRTLVVEAPTGSGKSTSLVAHLALSQPLAHRKTIVIEPRSILVHGLTKYVGDTFGLYTTGATSGSTFDARAQVWFMTPQAFLGHLTDISAKHDLVILDECHVNEPIVSMLVEMLPRWGFRSLYVSATPGPTQHDVADLSVSIPISQVFTSTVRVETIPSAEAYMSEALARVNSLPAQHKALVILDTPEMVDKAIAKSIHKAQGLSSRHSPIAEDVPRYFATSVVDVGVTIPGLRTIVSPNWVYTGPGGRRLLSDTLLRQRKGRVGRTNNGTLLLLEAQGCSFLPELVPTLTDGWRQVLSAGISPLLGWEFAPASMQEIFGLEDLSPSQVKDFARVSHIFMTNFRQLKAIENDLTEEEAAIGKPAVMVPTGSLGHFSSSVPQDLSALHNDAVHLLGRMLAAIKAGDNAFALLKDKLANVRSGPLYRVANVIQGLVNDPSGWRPELAGTAGSNLEVDFEAEIQEIHQLLDSLKGT